MQVETSASAVLEPTSSVALLIQPLLSQYLQGSEEVTASVQSHAPQVPSECQPLFGSLGLQLWILLASQDYSGLRDKPGKPADWYHTCYCLSGLAVAQELSGVVMGGPQNALRPTDARINVLPDRLAFARKYFSVSVGTKVVT